MTSMQMRLLLGRGVGFCFLFLGFRGGGRGGVMTSMRMPMNMPVLFAYGLVAKLLLKRYQLLSVNPCLPFLAASLWKRPPCKKHQFLSLARQKLQN